MCVDERMEEKYLCQRDFSNFFPQHFYILFNMQLCNYCDGYSNDISLFRNHRTFISDAMRCGLCKSNVP